MFEIEADRSWSIHHVSSQISNDISIVGALLGGCGPNEIIVPIGLDRLKWTLANASIAVYKPLNIDCDVHLGIFLRNCFVLRYLCCSS